MLLRHRVSLFAFASLLLLTACQEKTTQESTTAGDTASAMLDTSATASRDTAGDTAGDAAADTTTRNDGSRTSGMMGVDTTGTGPASISQDRYTTTSSGLKYYDFQPGSGASPSAGDRVRVHYTGWLQQSGRKFDSSYDRGQPATFRVGRVIKGWQEGLKSMKVGGQRQLVIPPGLAYGQQPPPGIPPGATLVFNVKLLGVEGASGGGAR